ncbi:hypothetical protein FSARC_6808 [Fusarium sarcochroum]|uniref:Uncharacterized protein n=1 Tax=Fusarium sarcochroum TaxID=1208366 RepID=A0A8H4TWX0_9HYPO|nr:hypothetical protein FSARC_6808 [Fusarium sarcochroum]
MSPFQGVSWNAGDKPNIGWTGGYDIKGKHSHTFSLELRRFEARYDKKDPDTVEIFRNRTFHYPSSSWKIWNEECLDTWISADWEIPEDFDVGDTKFVVWLFNTTDPKNETSMMSNLFFIDSNFTQTSAAVVSTAASATVTSLLAQETITSTPTATEDADDVQVTSVPSEEGLPASAKAGIGVGIGLLTLLLALAGLFFYRRKKRQTPGVMLSSFEKPELDGKTIIHSVAEADSSEIHQAPDNSTSRGTEQVEVPVVQQPIVHHINQDPIELPADMCMTSPKTSQEGLNR